MIIYYGFSMTGKSHITRDTCCQDNHKIKKLDNGWYIAAIADGVGSARNSQTGSKIAVDTVVTMCEEYMPWDYNLISIKSMMRTAYNYAYKQILRESERSKEPIESYDTTLTMVIYDGHKIIYGHSGDGAIIGLNTFGDYIPITKPQKGVDGVTVLPLRAGYTQWKIDSYEEELAAVLLMTDGMLDIFCPYLLKNILNETDRVYVPLASFFADPLGFSDDIKKTEKTIDSIKDFLTGDEKFDASKYYKPMETIYKTRIKDNAETIIEELKRNNYPLVLMQNVQDDKTIVGLINTGINVENREEGFYQEPDWQKLQEAWNRKAYPHLYKEKEESSEKIKEEKKTAQNPTVVPRKDAVDDKKDKKIEFVPLVKKPELDRARQAMEAYGKMANGATKKTAPPPEIQGTRGSSAIIKKEMVIERHDKPRKKGLMGKIEDAFD